MSLEAVLGPAAFLAIVLLLVRPLGAYIAGICAGEVPLLGKALGPLERGVYRVCDVDPQRGMNWREYALAMLLLQLVGMVFLYGLQRLQAWLPGNPLELGAVSPDSAFNTAVSFVTNTNWQGYGGESTMSFLTQMSGLAVANFLSAATGLSILFALLRGMAQNSVRTLGNFWADLVRITLYLLLPLSLLLSVALVSEGVVQTFQGAAVVAPIEQPAQEQSIALGPVASQVAIKQLGTNGGGFFNVNSAHPLENPTPLSNLLELLAILVIPAASCFAFGRIVKDARQGWTLLAAMLAILIPAACLAIGAEQSGNPMFARLGLDVSAGNLEGKELRFGSGESALWSVVTTATSNGSVNSMHDSFTPLGGLVPMVMMQLGEVVFGGVGSGLYGMLVFALIAVFVAGLMVGRTPEYLGKKIEAFEIKMASLAVLVPCALVLLGTALAVSTGTGVASMANPGPHGFSEVLYAFSSAANNNGSAFAGLSANTPFYNASLGLSMLAGRFFVALAVLAIAGSLAVKKRTPPSVGTLPTHGALFAALLVGVVLLIGVLSFVPALAMGPIVEHLRMS